MLNTFSFQTQNLHLDDGETVPAKVRCTPGLPLDIVEGVHYNVDVILPDDVHIALARVDPHVHFRESYEPSQEEFEADEYKDPDERYEDLLGAIDFYDVRYSVALGSFAALKGGVWLVGAMGNTHWAPIGFQRWKKTQEYYEEKAWVYVHVYPRMAPHVEPIPGQEEKDFGSTFGGSGLTFEQRREMYLQHQGGMVSYHNDRPRPDETIEQFRDRVRPPDYMLHHLYFNEETVLDCQRETLALAKEAQLKQLTTRHIPTGSALDMILQSRKDCDMTLMAEIGLDYLYWNRDAAGECETRYINYRRPAHPSKEEQAALITLTRECARKRDPLTFFGSDHAPHRPKAKAFQNGLPGSPGTRVLELTHQIHMHLIHQHGFIHADIDWLASKAPLRYLAPFLEFTFPVGTMQSGAMANLCVFHPHQPYSLNEAKMAKQLWDDDYHSAYRDEELRGKVWFTVVDGVVYDVREKVESLNL